MAYNQSHNVTATWIAIGQPAQRAFPVPAIAFLCVLGSCMVVLGIVYQLLKRGWCCNIYAGLDDAKPHKSGYAELLGRFYDVDDADEPTDDDHQGYLSSNPLSRRSSRRSSYELTAASKSDGELGLGDSASNCGEHVEVKISGPDDEMTLAPKLLLEFNYSMSYQKLTVSIVKASDLPSKVRGGPSAVHVRAVLLPRKMQRFKTKVRPASNPVFNESFSFLNIDQLAVDQYALRMRIYGQERYSQGRLLGEVVLLLCELDLHVPKATDEERQVWKTLSSRKLTNADSLCDLTDASSLASYGSQQGLGGSRSSTDTTHGRSPELLISLSYASLTGRLTVEVLKAANLRHLHQHRAPDCYIKIETMSGHGRRVAKSKTTIRRNMTDPEFNESFVFQMSEKDLMEVSLLFTAVSVSKARKKKEMIGSFMMGKEASGVEEIEHWNEMVEKKETKSTYFHALTM